MRGGATVRTFQGVEELRAAVGEDLGTSSWITVDQKRIDLFADATDDHQWIHVDPERAKGGPFGGTVAHGFLTVALIPAFGWDTFAVEGVSMTVNYGMNKVRFPAPVPVGSRVRGHSKLLDVTDVNGGVQATIGGTVEIEDQPKPACVAEVVLRYLF
jgi:acyl dehydratase